MRHVKVRHGDKYLVSEPPKGRLRRENGYISKKLSQNTNLNRKGHGKRLDIVLLDGFSTAALANSPASILKSTVYHYTLLGSEVKMGLLGCTQGLGRTVFLLGSLEKNLLASLSSLLGPALLSS